MVRPSFSFESEIFEGHKGVVALLVPFDPEEQWNLKPVRLEGRRHGWLVKGTVAGCPFDGYIGSRWDRFFIQLPPELLARAEARVGDTVEVTVRPTSSERTLERAKAQSRLTTQPKKARAGL
jgi:hypothetical protein